MPSTPPDRLALEILGAATVIAVVATAFMVARAVRRHVRGNARTRVRELLSLFADHLDARVSSRRLRRAVRESGSGVFWTALETFSLRLARRRWWILSAALERNPHWVDERRALRDESPWRRELAARRIALIDGPDSRSALRAAMRRGPELVAIAAAAGLARARDGRALRWLLDHPDTLRTRTRATWTGLLRSFGPGAHAALAAALERRPSSRVLELAIVETLGLGRFRAATPAIASLLREGDLEMRVASARALGRVHAAECAPLLATALDDPCWQVRAQAARALGAVGSVFAAPALAERLTDDSWWVRRHAAYALVALGDTGLDALRRTVEQSPDRYARDIAREALDGGFRRGGLA